MLKNSEVKGSDVINIVAISSELQTIKTDCAIRSCEAWCIDKVLCRQQQEETEGIDITDTYLEVPGKFEDLCLFDVCSLHSDRVLLVFLQTS